ncbi:HNH endonuclease [Rhodococcus sp. UNC23MFCrub1.1]|uniref:HNH endonuclease n=1 Tax=Rhodococcus sp. UNC23MFCrub1.1 TaxID=1449068 RepID=UPI00068FC4E8|nr:HNH endonuclease signature motif containing protein [Rhodococcus sp. UNC23MFCrub1.1]
MTWDSNSNTRHVPYKLQQRCFKRDNWACVQCGYVGGTPGSLFADHVVNKAAGGLDDLANLQTLCRTHHDAKTSVEIREGIARRQASLRIPKEPHPGTVSTPGLRRRSDPWDKPDF